MKRIKLLILEIAAMIAIFISVPAYANMAEPNSDNLASSITFEKNNELEVVSEVLDIKINGETADIKATYNMKNTTSNTVSTKSMILSPNINGNTAKVLVDNNSISYTSESYYVNYGTNGSLDGWKFVINDPAPHKDMTGSAVVDTVLFDMEFLANQSHTIEVSYQYRVGGYPTVDNSNRYASLTYYLTPASMWKNYGDITINLELPSDMPVIKNSTLEFDKVAKNKYQYKADELPAEELKLRIDQTGWQEFTSDISSGYILYTMALFSPYIIMGLIALIIVIIIIVATVKIVKRRKNKANVAY